MSRQLLFMVERPGHKVRPYGGHEVRPYERVSAPSHPKTPAAPETSRLITSGETETNFAFWRGRFAPALPARESRTDLCKVSPPSVSTWPDPCSGTT